MNKLQYMKHGEKRRAKSRENWYKQQYGMSLEEFWQLFENQEGLCAVCSKHLSYERRLTHVDHDHKTGKVRGILCRNCNIGLGHFRESETFLQNAIGYVRDSYVSSSKSSNRHVGS